MVGHSERKTLPTDLALGRAAATIEAREEDAAERKLSPWADTPWVAGGALAKPRPTRRGEVWPTPRRSELPEGCKELEPSALATGTAPWCSAPAPRWTPESTRSPMGGGFWQKYSSPPTDQRAVDVAASSDPIVDATKRAQPPASPSAANSCTAAALTHSDATSTSPGRENGQPPHKKSCGSGFIAHAASTHILWGQQRGLSLWASWLHAQREWTARCVVAERLLHARRLLRSWHHLLRATTAYQPVTPSEYAIASPVRRRAYSSAAQCMSPWTPSWMVSAEHGVPMPSTRAPQSCAELCERLSSIRKAVTTPRAARAYM